MQGIYVHIPFCERKCAYCAFSSFVCEKTERKRYIEALINEISSSSGGKADSIYLGGGTPSMLSIEEIDQILSAIKNKFALEKNSEITIECNPNSLTEEKLQGYKILGINRLSIGVQSLENSLLKLIGRLHTQEEAIEKVKLAIKYFDNVSVDMLIGLNDDKEEFLKEIELLTSLGVKHISTYMLQLEEETPLANMAAKNPKLLPDDDTGVLIYEATAKLLQEKGFKRYEVSNFAKEGYQSRHNLKYWSGEDYQGFGLAAHSFLKGVRHANANTFEGYYKGETSLEETLTKAERVEEKIMLGLRCCLGVNIEELKTLGYDIKSNSNYVDLLAQNYIYEKDDKFYLNPNYYGVSNMIILKLLPTD